MKIVQIGCNNGNDECNKFILEHSEQIDAVYLIEPLPNCIDIITERYKNIKNVKIFNIGITDNDFSDNTLNLYIPKNNSTSPSKKSAPEFIRGGEFEVTSLINLKILYIKLS